MTNETEAAQPQTRRVRSWIAFLLTFLGWGLGFYYARQTRAAIFWSVASVVVGIALGIAAWAYLRSTDILPVFLSEPFGPLLLTGTSYAISALVGFIAAGATAKRRYVDRASPLRLFGYLAIFLIPTLASYGLATSMRFFYEQPFRAPSSSMQPAVSPGDWLIVSKSSYGYGPYSTAPFVGLIAYDPADARTPQRGDIAVFRPVSEPDRDFVKRVIGLPGDQIQMLDGVLYINGAAVGMEPLGTVELAQEWGGAQQVQAFRETLPNGVSYIVYDSTTSELDNTRVFTLLDGQYFVMGDHRDNSADSRVASMGAVPAENFVGRVEHVSRAAPAR